MKTFIFPLLLMLVGAALLGFSFLNTGSANGELDVEIVKSNTLMPAAHNVYANENALDGKYYLFKAKITNNTNQTLKDIKVQYRIPNYIEWTEIQEIGEMFPGQTASVRCYPKLPENITEKTTESLEKVEITIDWDGASEDDIIEEEFDFKLTNRKLFQFTNIPSSEISGWSDVYDNTDLLACFVTPNDPIVQYYTQNIQEKILKGEDATVSKKPEEAVRFMAGIYNATLLSHMVYSGTKGMPASPQDVSEFSQENRLPREVITGNTGLCLELSLLYASIMSNAGLDPIIYLIPGHAYPGFLLNGQYFAIEATGIGGEGLGGSASAEKAFQVGMKNLDSLIVQVNMGNPQFKILNIHELNQKGATPMSLKDDQFLREKVESIATNWTKMTSAPAPIQPQQPVNNPTQTAPNNGRSDSNIQPAPQPTINAGYNIALPTNWQIQHKPYSDFPMLTANAMSPDQTVSVSIFDVTTNNAESAVAAIASGLSNFGQQLQYQVQGNQVSGVTYNHNNGNSLVWMGKIIPKGNGVRVVTIGSLDYNFEQKSSVINQLFNSIK